MPRRKQRGIVAWARKTRLLTKNNFNLAKNLLLAEEINSSNVEFNYLYVVNFAKQTVAVSDFIYRPFKRSIMRGGKQGLH